MGIDGKTYVLCPHCVRPCLYDFQGFVGDTFLCPVCRERTEETQCAFCNKVGGGDWKRVRVGGESLSLCPLHYSPTFEKARWADVGDLIAAIRGMQAQQLG